MSVEQQCPDCGHLPGWCKKCFDEWEETSVESIKARHALPVTEQEIERLRKLEIAAARVYMGRIKMFRENVLELYDSIKALGWHLGP